MDEGTVACAGCLVVFAIWAGLGLLVSWGIEWAWNLLIPALFHGPHIDFAMACALYFLVSVVFGAIGGMAKKS